MEGGQEQEQDLGTYLSQESGTNEGRMNISYYQIMFSITRY